MFDQIGKFIIPSLSIQSFAYHCHPVIGPTIQQLANPTRMRKYITLGLVTLGAAICYLLGGILPYLTLFHDHTFSTVILNDYHDAWETAQPFTMVAQTLYAAILFLTAALILITARIGFNDIVFFGAEMSTARRIIIGVSHMIGAALIAILVKSIGRMFDFIGGVTCGAIVYVFPALFYLGVCRHESYLKSILALFAILFGLGVMAVCLYHAIRQ
jgi:amino acid permease